MQPVFRGTTPTVTLLLSFDPRDAQTVWFTFSQNINGQKTTITKETAECELLEDRVRTRLTQEETLSFSSCERVKVQARFFMENALAIATRTYAMPVFDIARDGVIGPENAAAAPYVDGEVLFDATDILVENVGSGGTADHATLHNRDAADQHPIDAITGLREALNNAGQRFQTDDTLRFENGILSVNTADAPEQDNTLPITSAAVAQTVGNIETILKTI